VAVALAVEATELARLVDAHLGSPFGGRSLFSGEFRVDDLVGGDGARTHQPAEPGDLVAGLSFTDLGAGQGLLQPAEVADVRELWQHPRQDLATVDLFTDLRQAVRRQDTARHRRRYVHISFGPSDQGPVRLERRPNLATDDRRGREVHLPLLFLEKWDLAAVIGLAGCLGERGLGARVDLDVAEPVRHRQASADDALQSLSLQAKTRTAQLAWLQARGGRP
jgi:hypothetical protein